MFRESDLAWEPVVMTHASQAIHPFFKFEYCATNILKHIRDGAYFWYAHNPGQYCIRAVQDGDMLTVNTIGKQISVKQILQEAHVAPHLKAYYPVFEYGGEIQWIPGIRTSAAAMIDLSGINEYEVRHCVKAQFQKGTYE